MKQFLLASLLLFILPACQQLGSAFIEPTIDVVNIALLPTENFEQPLRVQLRLTNPNPYALPLKNFSYRIFLDNHNLVNGSTGQLSNIEANGSKVFSVDAHLNLFRGALWLKALLENNSSKVNYRIEADLETGSLLTGTIKLKEEGTIPLTQ